MARIHGQHGAIYVDISSAANGSAVPVAFTRSSKRGFNTDTQDVTAYSDTNHTYVAGKPDGTGNFEGFLDVATDQLWYASQDGTPRKFYDYVDTVGNPNKYWFGTGIFDFNVEQAVDSAATVTFTMKPASNIGRNWA